MRPAPFLAVAGALVAQAKTVVVSESGQVETVTACEPKTPSNLPTSPISSPTSAPDDESSTATVTTATDTSAVPDESATDGPDAGAGAVSQPMQSSVCGLLGFLIVGLVML